MADLTYDDAAHLLRRMGFGGSPDDITALAALGRDGAVNLLMNYPSVDNSAMESILASSFDLSDPDDPVRFNPPELMRWWYTRMVYTSRPFEEKMTLFWHNHFATAFTKVPINLMFIQNQMLRKNALARFDDLLLAVAQDPAMLVFLDGITNIQQAPNENFARELQELFTMGINDVVTGEPNYTQDDVTQIARAFTGWKFFQPSARQPFVYQFVVVPDQHDFGSKIVYGKPANYGGEDIVSIIAARRSTARFLVKKLLNDFVYPTTDAADNATIEKFADVYFSSGHSMASVLREIFTSDEFFSARARFALVKSPVELIVGSIRMLGLRFNPGTFATQNYMLPGFSILTGQELFDPPNVAGWPGGMAWINTATLLNRFTYADLLTSARTADLTSPGLWLSLDQLRRYTKGNAKKTVRNFLSVLGPLEVDSDGVAALKQYLGTGDQGQSVSFTPDDQTIDKKVRGLVHQIMCLSEFHLN